MSEAESRKPTGAIERIPDQETKVEWERLKQLRQVCAGITDPKNLTADQVKLLLWAVAKHLKIIP